MAHLSLCPSALMMARAILARRPDLDTPLSALLSDHVKVVHAIRALVPGRDGSLAITKAEEALMWALKGLADSLESA